MTSAILLAICCVRPFEAYTAVEVPHLPDKATFGQVFLTESGIAAGYWYKHVPPGHGGPVYAAPFAWKEGKLIALPLGEHEYGHALSGNDHVIVGDVELQYRWLPAMWTPDPTEGWTKSRLQVLSKNPGKAKCVAVDGSVWGDCDGGIWNWRQGTYKEFKIGRFEVIGIDEKGTLYLNSLLENQFSSSESTSGFRYTAGKLNSLNPEGAKSSRIEGVNRKGVAVGNVEADRSIATKWLSGKATSVSFNKNGYSCVNAINEIGDCVGVVNYRDEWRATLWKGEKLLDITNVVDGLKLFQGLAINSNGLILAASGGGTKSKLYLLTPVQSTGGPVE